MTFSPGKIYTLEMARAIRRMKKPVPFTMDVAETKSGLNLLVYESEFRPMVHAERAKVMYYLSDVANMLETFGVQVNIQGVPGEPRRL